MRSTLLLALVVCVLGQKDSCQDCLYSGEGWCEDTPPNNSSCFNGTVNGPNTPNICVGKWFFNVCPPVTLKNATIQPLLVGSTNLLCPSLSQCRLNNQAISSSGGIQSLKTFNVDTIPKDYVIYSVYFSMEASYCSNDGSENLTLHYGFDTPIFPSQQTIIQFKQVNDCSIDKPMIQTNIIPFPFFTIDYWLGKFNYSSSYSHTFSFSVPGQNSVSIVNLNASFEIININPVIESGLPLLITYCNESCSGTFVTLTIKNYAKLDYKCLFTRNNESVVTNIVAVDSKHFNCSIPFGDPIIPSPDYSSPVKLQLSLIYGLNQSILSYTTAPTNLTIFRAPNISSLNPPNGTIEEQHKVLILGNGFLNTGSIVIINNKDQYAVTFINSTAMEFKIPKGNKSSTRVCVQVSFKNSNYKSKCLYYTYIAEPNNIWKDSLFYILIAIGILSVFIVGIIIFCRLKNKKKEPYARITDETRKRIETKIIKQSDIETREVIGVGSFATVYKGTYNGDEVAVKVIRNREKLNIKEKLLEEAGIMQELVHPNIVRYLGSCFDIDLCIITEFVHRGSLYSILHDDNIIIEQEHIRKFALDTCKGMEYLHSCNIIHRDLKTHNLLVDNEWTVKVSDFGLARSLTDAQNTQTLTACGTPSWAAPEVLKEQKYSLKADIYSFAICLWELVTRKKPYTNMTTPQVIIAVAIKGKRLPTKDIQNKDFSKIITECWQEDTKSRPTFSNLCITIQNLTINPPKYLQPHLKSETEEKLSVTETTGLLES